MQLVQNLLLLQRLFSLSLQTLDPLVILVLLLAQFGLQLLKFSLFIFEVFF